MLAFAAAFFWVTYTEVKRDALSTARARLSSVSEEMAKVMDASNHRMRLQVPAVARLPEIVAFLNEGTAASERRAQALLDSLTRQSAVVAGLEIWGIDGMPLLSALNGISATDRELAESLISRLVPYDTILFGAHRTDVDTAGTSFVHFPMLAPVRDGERRTGYVAVHRRHFASQMEVQQIRDLIGDDVGFFVGSPETGVWTDLAALTLPPPIVPAVEDSIVQYEREGSGLLLASAARVSGTPWMVIVEFPHPHILAGNGTIVRRLAFATVVLLLLGWLGGWYLSRDITGPITAIADDAAAVARGDFSRRVAPQRHEELRRLADAFNHMAASVGASVERLAGELVERKRAQESLMERDETIRAIFEASPLAIASLSVDGKVQLWNRAAERVFGWSQAEVIGGPLPIVDEAHQQEHDDIRRRVLAGETFTGREIRRMRRDGTQLQLTISCGATYDSAGNPTGATAIFEDVTEGRKLEDQLRQAQKMEAIGRLAGGIAHDFNNLLTVVLGASDILLHELPEDSEHKATVREIREAGDRAAALTTQLLTFSRRQHVEPKVLVLNDLVADMDRILRRLIGEDIRVSTRLDPLLGAVKADQGQIEQVLMNLAVNARDAMPNGGEMILETANVTLDESYVQSHAGAVAGEYAMLSVSDTGVGMSEETRAHIFEPFFTTKELGKGTGLGLPTCYGIVAQAGGHIGVYSEPGVGTTMKVYLPLVENEATSARRTRRETPRGDETILLVEDDDAVRAITARMLTSLGYDVIEAPDGATAIGILESRGDEVDLLLTDVVLPGIGGREVAEQARALRPGIKVLFASGYNDDVILKHRLLDSDVMLLQKPFTAVALSRKVRAVLSKENDPPPAEN